MCRCDFGEKKVQFAVLVLFRQLYVILWNARKVFLEDTTILSGRFVFHKLEHSFSICVTVSSQPAVYFLLFLQDAEWLITSIMSG